MVRMEKMERTALMVYHLEEMEVQLMVEMEVQLMVEMEVQLMVEMEVQLMVEMEVQLMAVRLATVVMGAKVAQLLLEMGVVPLVVMEELVEVEEIAGTLTEETVEDLV